MEKKILGILIVGLLMVTIIPVNSSLAQPTEEKHITKVSSQIEIKLKGGWGATAFIKNIGTTDLNDVYVHIVFDGSLIFPDYKDREATMDLRAGKTQILIFPVRGFGATNLALTVDTKTVTASGKVLGSIVFGVH